MWQFILAVAIIPFTRSILGTSIGETVVIVQLTIAAVGLTYSYQSFNDTIMYTTLDLLIIIVGII